MSNEINDILEERGSNYGEFKNQAMLSKHLRAEFFYHHQLYGQGEIEPYIEEGITMVLHKLARLANGKIDYIDGYRDIIGYAQLIVNELEKTDGSTDARVTKIKRINGEWEDVNE